MIDVTKQFNEFFGVNAQADARDGFRVGARNRNGHGGRVPDKSRRTEREISARHPTHTPTSRGLEGPVKDPFDQYARTPVALYRDGRQYEADEMTAGATP